MFLKRDLKSFTCRLIQIIKCLTPKSPFSVDSFGLDHLTKLISNYTLLCLVDIFFSFNKTVNITLTSNG